MAGPTRASGRSPAVTSNQAGPHPRLAGVLARHRAHPSRRPWPAHAAAALAPLAARVAGHGGPLVLDAGCGSAESTGMLAVRHPDALVVGIDQSAARLARAASLPANALLVRARIEDVWRLAREQAWPVAAQYLFYPNPWPKQHQLMRRWHAHPALADLVALGGYLELRTNWAIYAEEFAAALRWWCGLVVAAEAWCPACAESAFERKYLDSGHALQRVVATLPPADGGAARRP
ncbi:MAG: SAM-dependent methyltransferase [Gammaproteobacteria bacterium]